MANHADSPGLAATTGVLPNITSRRWVSARRLSFSEILTTFAYLFLWKWAPSAMPTIRPTARTPRTTFNATFEDLEIPELVNSLTLVIAVTGLVQTVTLASLEDICVPAAKCQKVTNTHKFAAEPHTFISCNQVVTSAENFHL